MVAGPASTATTAATPTQTGSSQATRSPATAGVARPLSTPQPSVVTATTPPLPTPPYPYPVSGWLTKQGDVVRNYKRRYFVLSTPTAHALPYYERPGDKKERGSVVLRAAGAGAGAGAVRVSVAAGSARPFAFEVRAVLLFWFVLRCDAWRVLCLW